MSKPASYASAEILQSIWCRFWSSLRWKWKRKEQQIAAEWRGLFICEQ